MKLLFKNLGTILLSLLLALLVWVAAVREQNPPREADFGQNIPIEVIPPAAGLVTTDALPETVRLRLLAPQSSWQNLSPSKFKATVDLSKLAEGFNDVPVKVVVSDPEVRIVGQTPQAVTVNLQAEQTITLPVKVVVVDNPPVGYINRPPVTVPQNVVVTGPASLISRVNEAVTEIYIRSSKETIERILPVQVKDRTDRAISGLLITPPEVQITLPIEQRFGYKDVAVSAVVAGQAAPGYWVSNISVNPPRVTVVGNPAALNAISGFIETTPVNVSQATADVVRTVPLDLPDGVAIIAPEGETAGTGGVEVTVQISAIESGQTIQRPVIQQGIDPRYSWAVSPERVDVILSGPIPQLQTLQPDEVKVIVDLFNLQPGVHKVRPAVFVPDSLRVKAVLPDTVEVTITLPTPTPTPTPTRTPAPTPTPAVSRTPTRIPQSAKSK